MDKKKREEVYKKCLWGMGFVALAAIVGVLAYKNRPLPLGHLSPNSHYNSNGNPKVSYSSPLKARREAKRVTKMTGEKIEAYKCVYCAGNHIGHKTSRYKRQSQMNNIVAA